MAQPTCKYRLIFGRCQAWLSAIAQVDLMEAVGLKHEEHCSTYITFDEPTVVSVNGAGKMFQGSDTLVDTVSDPEDEYDEYEGADYDDEDDE